MKLFILFSAALLFITVHPTQADIPPFAKKNAHLYISHFENVLGTSMELKVMATSPDEAAFAETLALQEISRMSAILSAYDKNSEFSRWERSINIPVPISKELYEVLDLFDQWRSRSGGALDASAEAISKLWKRSAALQQLPTAQELTSAVNEVKQLHWKLDATAQTATHLSNTPLMLNSFVKSYIIRHATQAAMRSPNVRAIVLNIGGDLVVAGDLAEKVQISDPKAAAENDAPMDLLQISNKAVATSGNYRRGELINGQWYSHIVDPRTGQPADNILSATVVAPNATDAGALATAFNVMSTAESVQLAATIPGAEYLIITKDGERIASKGWKALEIPIAKIPTINTTHQDKAKIAKEWDNEFELIVNLEINLQATGFVKRPYIAIWVEDENHAAVRTLTVWHGNQRYMNELKSWYMKYRDLYSADKNFSSSVSGATRPAGKYTVKWDGKDDKGKTVKPGKYIIKIEAAREHGTYQLMRQEIDCDKTAKQINIPGNIEIASASLDYRKKTNGN